MQVTVIPSGLLQDYFGTGSHTIELKAGARLEDLLAVINCRWSGILPRSVWSAEKTCFRGNVMMISDRKLLKDKSTPLANDQVIKIVKSLIGG